MKKNHFYILQNKNHTLVYTKSILQGMSQFRRLTNSVTYALTKCVAIEYYTSYNTYCIVHEMSTNVLFLKKPHEFDCSRRKQKFWYLDL